MSDRITANWVRERAKRLGFDVMTSRPGDGRTRITVHSRVCSYTAHGPADAFTWLRGYEMGLEAGREVKL